MQTLLTHGETAFLVAPHDPAAIAAGIRWVVEHPAEAGRMGHAARELVQRSFSVEQMVAQTLAVYDRLMR